MIEKLIKKYNSASVTVRAGVWYTLCNVLNKGIALLSTPIFTRILTEEQYGDFAIFHSWYSILLIISSLNIFMSGYTKGLLKFKDDVDGFTSSQLSLTTIITVIWGIIYILNISFWTEVLQIKPILMAAMFAQLLIMPAFEFWIAKERFFYHYKGVVLVTLLSSILCVGISVVAVLASNDKLVARVYSDSLVKVSVAGVLFAIIMFKGKKIYRKEYWKYALIFNLPLLPHFLANYALSQSDRLMIGRMVGSSEAAFYSVAYTISMMLLLVVTALNSAIEPYLYRSLESKKIDAIAKKTMPLIIMVGLMTIAVMAFAPEVIYIFAGNKYMDAIYVIPPISAALYFIYIYSLYSAVEYFYQKTTFIAIATCISAALNIVLNYFGIKMFGYHAAGYTTLICYIILAILHYSSYKKIIKDERLDTNDIYSLKTILLVAGFILIILFLMVMTYNRIIVRYSIIGLLIVFASIKHKTIEVIFKGIMKK